MRYRVGRKVGRTIYTVDKFDGDGTLIGVMDTRMLAAMFVEAANDHDMLKGLEMLVRDEHVARHDEALKRTLYRHTPAECDVCAALMRIDEQRNGS